MLCNRTLLIACVLLPLHHFHVVFALQQRPRSGATIEAKPRIKKLGDATKFMPVALRVRRNIKDSTGRPVRQSGTYAMKAVIIMYNENIFTVVTQLLHLLFVIGSAETSGHPARTARAPAAAVTGSTKDDAYDQFMKEMQSFF